MYSAQFMLRKCTLSWLLAADLSLLSDRLPGMPGKVLKVQLRSACTNCIIVGAGRAWKDFLSVVWFCLHKLCGNLGFPACSVRIDVPQNMPCQHRG